MSCCSTCAEAEAAKPSGTHLRELGLLLGHFAACYDKLLESKQGDEKEGVPSRARCLGSAGAARWDPAENKSANARMPRYLCGCA